MRKKAFKSTQKSFREPFHNQSTINPHFKLKFHENSESQHHKEKKNDRENAIKINYHRLHKKFESFKLKRWKRKAYFMVKEFPFRSWKRRWNPGLFALLGQDNLFSLINCYLGSTCVRMEKKVEISFFFNGSLTVS